jgi:hypothetical protein
MIYDKYRGKNTSPQCVKMDLQEVRCEGLDWIKLDQDRDRCQALVNAVMNLQVP